MGTIVVLRQELGTKPLWIFTQAASTWFVTQAASTWQSTS